MQVTIKISPKVDGTQRAVYWNDELSHHIPESDIQNALEEARLNFWQFDEAKGAALGARLYDILNGNAGQLHAALTETYHKGEPLHIYLNLPFTLDALPVELLYRERFLLLDSHIHLIRQVTDRNLLKNEPPEKRMLKLLFMACSPINLAGASLQFEKEEERTLQQVEKFPVDTRIEDSGSAEGLAEALYEGGGYDIVHITGHAGIDSELGPVFYMEDDIGELAKVTPDMLWEKIKAFPPKLLLLSGCSTAKSDKLNASESFTHLMVQKGISFVLGWGLPVSDAGATALTTELYRYLAMGNNIDEAVQFARQVVEKDYHPWPLLRLFTDGSKLQPLIAAGQQLRYKSSRTTTYKSLADSQVRVLQTGFVGRRREIQSGVRILKGAGDKYGLLIRGPAGVGKSCLAGKLIERFPKKELIVLRGELKKVDLLQQLRNLFDRKGLRSGLEILKADMEFEEKIKALFRGVLQELSVLIYLDDFEQNLVRRGDEYHLTETAIEIITPILIALDWAEGKTNLIITSRYPFVLEVEGKNLPAEKLEDISLMSFRGPDLEKKKGELPHISASAHSEMYMEFGKGNPRLLEWLEQIVAEETKYDLNELKQALQGKHEEYIRAYLAEIMAKTQGEDFHHFLHQAAVFRQPVEQSAFAMLGSTDLLQKGVNLTLIEREQPRGREAVYWVAPIIRDSEWEKLSTEEKFKIHQLAYRWCDEKIGKSAEPDYQYLEEAVHHAMESDNIRGACKHAITLGKQLDVLLLYREKVNFQQRVINRITDTVITEALAEKDSNIAELLNNCGVTLEALGDARKAIEYYEKGLQIDISLYGEKHSEVATVYNNFGLAWYKLGDARKAIEYYEKALEINLSIDSEQHQNVAINYNCLGAAWAALDDAQKAKEYYEKALEIVRNIFGEKHADVAIYYNNLGDAWRMLGDIHKAIEYYEKALKINLSIYDEKHPTVAINYNNLGVAWNILGNARKAITYYAKALETDLELYDEKHPNLARDYNNLGLAYHALGNTQKAIEYLEKALKINLNIYGEKHPDVAINYNSIGAAWATLGEFQKAIEYYGNALKISFSIYGEKHHNVATAYNNIGSALYALGDAQKAITYTDKALEINLGIYGEKHPQVAVFYNNLGLAWRALGASNKEKDNLEKALEIALNVYGEKHPDVARVYMNLGFAYIALGDIHKAIECYEKALKINLSIYGKKHSIVANDYNNLGSAWDTLGNFRKAINYYEKALEIDLNVYNKQHPSLGIKYNNLGTGWYALGDFKKAMDYFEKALEIFTTVYGNDHVDTQTVKKNLEALKSKHSEI